MKKFGYARAFAILACAALFAALAPRAKAQDSSIAGQVLDFDGKPWPDFAVTAESDQGAKLDTKTDKNGKYSFTGLHAGTYKLSVMLPMQKDPYAAAQVKVSSGQTAPVDLNLQELVAKKNPEYVAALKKQGEEGKKFQGMKQHFEAGVAALDLAKQAKDKLGKAPADQRDPLKAELSDNANKAVTEFEAAKAATNEKDSNLPLIMARLGDAYDAAGRADDAITAYKRSIELKPTFASYNNLGGIYGRAGKLDDATAAYQKAAETDPAQAAQAWRNFGITMYNANRMKDAVDPLKKATAADPKNPQAWYLLGASLVGTIDSTKDCKVTGDKMDCKIPDGTVEAYQKALELDPNGPYGQQAKDGLAGLEAMSSGIQTKMGMKKKKT